MDTEKSKSGGKMCSRDEGRKRVKVGEYVENKYNEGRVKSW